MCPGAGEPHPGRPPVEAAGSVAPTAASTLEKIMCGLNSSSRHCVVEKGPYTFPGLTDNNDDDEER